MKTLNFHNIGEDDGHFYILASCECDYQSGDQSIPSRLALYFSPTEGFSRFSFQCWSLKGESQMYCRGPDYSPCPEAALLDIWVQESVPAYVWRLYPKNKCIDFHSSFHEISYHQARKELCAALYGLRVKAWSQKNMIINPLIQPPPGGYIVADAFSATQENAEFMQAAIDAEER